MLTRGLFRRRCVVSLPALAASLAGVIVIAAPPSDGATPRYPPIPYSKALPQGCIGLTASSTLPTADIEPTRAAVSAMAGRDLQFLSACPQGIVILGLTPGSEGIAARIGARFGGSVQISVGLTKWKGRPGRSPRCGTLPASTEPPRGIAVSLHLATRRVRAGSNLSGDVVFRNGGSASFEMDTGQPLQAVVLRPGTQRVVGVYTGGIAGTGFGPGLSPGHSSSVQVVGGTARCDGGYGSALPPGRYQVVALVMDERGTGPRYLTPPVPLTITG